MGPDREPQAEMKVAFPVDDPDAMLLLLYVAHLHFDKVPNTVDLATLRDLAIVCDKYDCAIPLAPWLRSWILDPLRSPAEGPNSSRLFMAWVFGDQKTFTENFRGFVWEGRHGEDEGSLIYEGEDPRDADLLGRFTGKPFSS